MSNETQIPVESLYAFDFPLHQDPNQDRTPGTFGCVGPILLHRRWEQAKRSDFLVERRVLHRPLVDWFTFDLMRLTEEAEQKLSEYYGPSADVCVRDSIGEDGKLDSIFVVARVLMTSDEALSIMDRLDEDWWLNQSARAGGRIHIAFEHRKDT